MVVVGSGGREHAICWKLCQSPKVQKVYAIPGSDAIKQLQKLEVVPGVNVNNIQVCTIVGCMEVTEDRSLSNPPFLPFLIRIVT